MRQFAVVPLAIIGVLVLVLGFAFHSIIFGIIGLAILVFMYQFSRGKKFLGGDTSFKPPVVPPGFNITFFNKNIAYDEGAGAFWLVDQAGTAGKLHKSEITSYQALSDSSNHQTTVGPKTVRLNNRLLIKTTNLSKPVWTIKFNAHPERTQGGSDQNYAELSEWDARLDAILR